MIALGIRYLTGCAVSSDMTRQRHEFPPHPGRVFMAMAAAHFETKGDADERRALEWVERQAPAPYISAPDFSVRRAMAGGLPIETYVPVNDKHGGIAARSRQARSFPTVRLHGDKVFLLWNTAAPEEIRAALDRLCSKVTRIGHSSSLVQMWVAERPEEIRPNFTPDDFFSERRMRVAEPGTLAYLERAFERSEWPSLARWQGYRQASEGASERVFEGLFDSRLIVFEKFEGRVLGLESTLQLSSALRNAAMKAAPQSKPPEWLSGHQRDGSASLKAHVAFFPLPFVGERYADGHVLGMAMAIPRAVSGDEARRVIAPLLFDTDSGREHTIRLWRNDVWEWHVRRETRERPQTALRAETWTKVSRTWATVTPVVLHHHPKKNREHDVERILHEAFVSAGLPAPKALRASPVSKFSGALDARSMPAFSEGGDGLCRYQTHAIVEFGELVAGPVLVGRGRYRGYGLFRPFPAAREQAYE